MNWAILEKSLKKICWATTLWLRKLFHIYNSKALLSTTPTLSSRVYFLINPNVAQDHFKFHMESANLIKDSNYAQKHVEFVDYLNWHVSLPAYYPRRAFDWMGRVYEIAGGQFRGGFEDGYFHRWKYLYNKCSVVLC